MSRGGGQGVGRPQPQVHSTPRPPLSAPPWGSAWRGAGGGSHGEGHADRTSSPSFLEGGSLEMPPVCQEPTLGSGTSCHSLSCPL